MGSAMRRALRSEDRDKSFSECCTRQARVIGSGRVLWIPRAALRRRDSATSVFKLECEWHADLDLSTDSPALKTPHYIHGRLREDGMRGLDSAHRSHPPVDSECELDESRTLGKVSRDGFSREASLLHDLSVVRADGRRLWRRSRCFGRIRGLCGDARQRGGK